MKKRMVLILAMTILVLFWRAFVRDAALRERGRVVRRADRAVNGRRQSAAEGIDLEEFMS